MADIIIADPEKIDKAGTLAELEEITEIGAAEERKVSLLAPGSWDGTIPDGTRVYLPAEKFTEGVDAYVYVELECYPFFRKAREEIEKADQPKGVFRLRRTGECGEPGKRAAGDLLAVSRIFGEPAKLSVKRSKEGVEPRHMIVTAVFGEGVMAHLEYTFSGEEKVELEWSGVRRIIEFSSEELGFSPFSYPAESVLAGARKADGVWLEEWRQALRRIAGGEKK